MNSPLLEELKRLYDAGDKSRLLAAIRYCGEHKLVMPDWVVDEFRTRTDAWFLYEFRELGDALGVSRKGVHIEAAKKKKRLKHQIYNRIINRGDREPGIGEKLFDKIGKEFHISSSEVRDYFYEVKNYVEKGLQK